DRDRRDAVVRRGRLDVAHAVDAVDGLLDGDRDRRLDDLRAGAGVDGGDGDLRRGQLRVLGDGQRRDGDGAADECQERADGREDRAADEEVDEHYLAAGCDCGGGGSMIGAPSWIFCAPSATTFSPAFRPARTL